MINIQTQTGFLGDNQTKFISTMISSYSMYDAVIIGAGPAGYVCATTLGKGGAKVCVVEKGGLGGTCTQTGCIPTKFLHSVGDTIRKAKAGKKFGIKSSIEIDYTVLKSKMKSTVSKLASGIELLFKENGVELIQGEASLKSANEVEINGKILETKNIVLATGSQPKSFQKYSFDDRILSTDSIFDLENLPESILIVGGGYSGCEFASILNVLGCKVWLVEMEETLLPGQPKEVGSSVEKFMKLDGIEVMTKSGVEKIEGEVIVNGKKINPEKILISIGRNPNIETKIFEDLGIVFDENGLKVNEKMQTSLQNVYAIGDITGHFELAHVASRQGEVAAQNILGKNSTMDYSVVPYCVFTYPEVAVVGKCEGHSGEFQLSVNAKANCLGDTRGFVKVFEENGILQGAIILAPHASELIGEVALAIKLKLKPKDVIETIHAHPTLPEAFVDALKNLESS
jgi:dihydrolipoamide dehydrogenase